MTFPAPIINGIRRWNCLHCAKLFFEAYLPENSYIIIKCHRCGHINIIRPIEYSAAMDERAAAEVRKCETMD